jgi:hypothetical protein
MEQIKRLARVPSTAFLTELKNMRPMGLWARRFLTFAMKYAPGRSLPLIISTLGLVAAVIIQIKGMAKRRHTITMQQVKMILEAELSVIFFVSYFHLYKGQDSHHDEYGIRDRRGVTKLGVSQEDQIIDILGQGYRIFRARGRNDPRLVKQLERAVG